MSEQYLIWSNEHKAWWGPDRCGYTTSIERAGRYQRDEAIKIATVARGGWRKGRNPDEIAIPEADAIEQATDTNRYEVWANTPPAVCRGSLRLGTGCGHCARCERESDDFDTEIGA